MSELKYIVEDRILAELLGVQNFSNKESAILELVKNAFDANALNVKIKIYKDRIEILDNGCGMNERDLTQQWMHIGKSSKGYEIDDKNGKKRIQAGSKGVGRFALARLGEKVELESLKENSRGIRWSTDWNSSELVSCDDKVQKGTLIKIRQLRDKWTEKTVMGLAEYLGRTYCDTAMIIELFFNDHPIEVKRMFISPQKGVNYSSKIELTYIAKEKKLVCKVDNDEFLDVAQELCKNNIKKFNKEIDLLKEYQNKEFEDDINDLENSLIELGDFTSEIYFSLDRVLAGDDERFLYKRKVLSDRYNSGIILYRNSFSISSYEGKKDWLGLGKRSRKSPAAATHPTGSWRVRENQVSGIVNIDKKKNAYLQDLANRQGIDENKFYQLFVEIIHTGLEEFERYRQSLIRDINKKNKVENENEDPIISKIIKTPSLVKKLSRDEQTKFVDELEQLQNEKKEFKRSIEDTEKRYKYDVRILNILATSGLKATSIAHEMRNDRNKIDGSYDYIVKALKQYEVWDVLIDPENTKIAHKNVPALLEKNREADIKLLQFMDIMLEEVEKEQFIPEEHNIKKLLDKVIRNWKNDYAWLEIIAEYRGKDLFVIPEDVINVIFDNLILNSIQQNEKKKTCLTITIKITVHDDLIYVFYCDDGVGLPEKFKDNPMKILEPHESSRKKGHGLGMWILNNTLDMSGGEVIDITSKNGFEIEFTIGGNL